MTNTFTNRVGRRATLACAVLAGTLALAQPLVGHSVAAGPDPVLVEGGRQQLERSFDVLCRPFASSVLRVVAEAEVGDARLSHAVVVGEEGLLLAKLSELGSDGFYVLAPDGTRREATILASDLGTDLALLSTDDAGLEPVAFSAEPVDWRVGQWIAAVGPGGDCIGLGAVSVGPRDLATENNGFLGVELDRTVPDRALIGRVLDDGAAISAGIQAGDVVLAIDGQPMRNSESVISQLRRTVPGQEVDFTIRRGEESFDRVVRVRGRRLDDYQNPFQVPHAADSVDVSARRDGFPSVVQNDANLLPSECLSLAIDSRGRVVGLHVARMDRPGSLTLPTDVVAQRLERLLERAERSVQAKSLPVGAGETRDV
ncbi:serine endoprotease [Planctomycetes bacterium Pla163]|uniref:Serine endoprotease n=1 Tax=Rohdeia mirabilis TaxID=2528008 RepID=A0A518CUN5_9BACT|nr:serine endoprotease [Planctomycetes bacterium Pla163]